MKKIIIILTLLFSSNCLALTGNDLYKWLTNNNGLEKNNSYYFIMGVMDIQEAYKATEINLAGVQKRKPELKIYYCPPKGIIYGQAYDVVQKYLYNHPEKRQQEGYLLVHDALNEVWPCQ